MNLLKNYHTKQLKKMLNLSYKFDGLFWCESKGVIFDSDEIREELKTREHVPNKIEAKKIRQEKARLKKNR